MKSLGEIEARLLDGSEAIKRSGLELIGNLGKLIAVLCALITALITFTDVSFTELNLSDTLPQLLLLLTSSYVIYFSLEDAGERLGEQSAEFKGQRARHSALCERLGGEDTRALAHFLEEYLQQELDNRRKRALIYYGLDLQMLHDYLDGKEFDKKRRRILKRISKMRPASLCLSSLISCGNSVKRTSPYENPEHKKLIRLLIKLIPSTICTALTVSVMLTVKGDMGASDILGAILKLSALPIIGFRGYAQGYSYIKNESLVWYRIRCDIIEEFIEVKKQKVLDKEGEIC